MSVHFHKMILQHIIIAYFNFLAICVGYCKNIKLQAEWINDRKNQKKKKKTEIITGFSIYLFLQANCNNRQWKYTTGKIRKQNNEEEQISLKKEHLTTKTNFIY